MITRAEINGLPIINVESNKCNASVSLYGAHLLSFKPAGHEETLYMSPTAIFANGKAIRGGVPVCWPWFGPISTPQHGYARINFWKEAETTVLENGDVKLVLTLTLDQCGGMMGTMEFIFGETMTQTLITTNGAQQYQLTEALHSYWKVSDISQIYVEGLESAKFFEKSANAVPHSENPLKIEGEVDRVYCPTAGVVSITDTGLGRKITIERSGSNSVIVWNIGAEGAKKMADMPDDGYKQYLCIETGNAPGDEIDLAPGASHTISYTVSVSKL